MDTVPTSVVECALLDGAPPQLGDGGAWCDAHNKCDHCAQDVVDAMSDELRRLKAERDRALAELDKALGEREDAMLSERNAAYNAGFDEGFASADDWLAQHEDAMAEHGWVKLPVDADGEPWHIGDRDEMGDEITSLKLTMGVWFYFAGGMPRQADSHRHHHAPTVEDMLDEFIDKWLSTPHDSERELFAEYAEKLRLSNSEE